MRQGCYFLRCLRTTGYGLPVSAQPRKIVLSWTQTNAERILYAFTSRPDIVPSPKFAPIQTHPCVRGTSRVRHCGPPRHIFLTGGTGYFGFTLFHHFLQDDTLCQVTVIVRARSIEQARQCVIKLASIAGWWQNKYTARIRVWVGDLSRTHLGLSDSQLLELSGVGVNEQQAVDATCTTVLRSTSTTISTCGQSGSIKLKSPALLTAKFWSAVNAVLPAPLQAESRRIVAC